MNLEEISLIKSSTGITRLFADTIIERTLTTNSEELNKSPVGSLANLITGIGDLAANAFFEQHMIKREMHKNTAISLKSLLRYLDDSELTGIFGYPSQTVFFLGLPYNYLLKNAIVDTSLDTSNIKHARINKESQFILLSKSVFVLDHAIDIYIVNPDSDNPTFNVSYDVNDKYSENFSIVNNPYLNTKILNYAGTKYLTFEVIGRQYERTESIFTIETDALVEKYISYTNQLMGFEVLYKTSEESDYKVLTGYPEGVSPANGYNYSLVTKNGTPYIVISFSQNESDFNLSSRSTVKVIVYTTTGESGNMTFPDLDVDRDANIQFTLKPDTKNAFEQAVATMTPLITVKSTESTGGRNQMTFEEIRNYVISKSSDSRTITPSDIERKAQEFGCTAEKVRHDIALIYRINSILKDSNGYISSGSGIFRFNLNDIPIRSEIAARIIKPSFIFKYNSTDEYYYYQPEPDSLLSYLDDYRNNRESQVSFPYYIKITFSNILKSEVWNLSFDKDYFTSINYYDAYALDTVSIERINLYRNPTVEKPTEENIEKGIEGLYVISFNAIVGQNIYKEIKEFLVNNNYDYSNNRDQSPILFRLLITDSLLNKKYYTDCTITDINDVDMRVRVKAVLVTNNNINDSDNICITDSSLVPVPIPLVYESFYYLSMTVDVKILIGFKSEEMFEYRNTENDLYLTSSELEKKYYISTIYDAGTVTLGENFTDQFNFNMDVKLNDTQYQRYKEDVYETYSETIYERDNDGQIIYTKEERTNDLGQSYDVSIPHILHSKGDLVLDENEQPILLFPKGSIKYDLETGLPIQEGEPSYYSMIYTVPWFDRIFNVSNKYFEIEKSYRNLLDIMTAMGQTIIDGIGLTLGLKRNSGPSQLYSVFNKSSELNIPLDNLAISLEMGVKFSDDLSDEDKEYNANLIVEKTKEYIYNHDNDVFSINDLFIYLKSNISNIVFFEHYYLNNYDSNTCQALYKDTSISAVKNESLCVKMDIDDENSDFNEEIFSFKPAITVNIL